MKFAAASIGSLAFQVLLVRPEWEEKGVTITHKLDTQVDVGRTSIEERRPIRAALLLTQKCRLQAYQSEADDWRKGLAALGTNRIGMPLWVDALPTSAWGTRIYDPQQIINFDPNTDQFEIIAKASMPSDPTTLPFPMIAPLIIGYWAKRPPMDVIAGALGEIDIELMEASPFSCRVGIVSVGTGWIQNPDRTSDPQDLSTFALELITSKSSTAREPALDATNVAQRWSQEADFTFMSRSEIGTALTWFVANGGMWQSWSGLPAWLQPGTATPATPNSYTVRFASDTIELQYHNASLATSHIGFLQEIQVTGRTQALPGVIYLYQIQYQADPSNPDLYTNYDAPITIGSSVFNPAQVDLKQLRMSLRPQDEQAQVVLPYVAGSIIDDWTKNRLYKPVTVSIWTVDPNALPGSLANPLFVGYITKVEPNGTNQTITASMFGPLLSRRVPVYSYGQTCNTHLFSGRCGLAEADYDSSGTLLPSYLAAEGIAVQFPAGVITGWMGSNPAYPYNWFAMGTLRTGTGRKTVVALITSSTTGDDGVLTLWLSRPIYADMIASGGQSCQVVPGCDGQYVSSCVGKYNNAVNNRSMPFIPQALQTVTAATPLQPKK
jgi:hypothetical protein